jgi:hypothetical protein
MNESKAAGHMARNNAASSMAGLFIVVGAAISSSAPEQQCATGQNLCSTYAPTGVVRIFGVPGGASALASGLFVRPGFVWRMTAVGSIRVGIFGETGTPPDGWVPQGPAGNGFPSPDAYSFSLLYRVGPAGAWQLLGTGQAVAKLGPRDPAALEIFFGINDTKLSDNSGAFAVTLTEFAVGTTCCTPQPPATGSRPSFLGSSSAVKAPASGGAKLPCAGKTPNGLRQSFQFQYHCEGGFRGTIPVEACGYAEARSEAQALATGKGVNCALTQ